MRGALNVLRAADGLRVRQRRTLPQHGARVVLPTPIEVLRRREALAVETPRLNLHGHATVHSVTTLVKVLTERQAEKLPRLAVDSGVTDGWWKYGCAAVVGLHTFGDSAPAPVRFNNFGCTSENVAMTVEKVLRKKK